MNAIASARGATPQTRDIFRLALALHQAGRLDDAIKAYLVVLAKEPRHVDALCLLATALHRNGRPDDALALVRRALGLRQDVVTLCLFASLHRSARHYAQSEDAYRKALELAPDNAEIHQDLALLLCDTGRHAEAEVAYRRALELKPDFADAHNNLGVLLKKTGRLAEARTSYRRAIAADARNAEAHNNLGVIDKESGRLAEAEAAYRRAIELKPDYADARWNLALVLLTLGRYAEAWPYYEARHHAKRSEAVSRKPPLPFPQWRGEAIAGKSLLIWTEQGHGDFVQFARYVPLLKQRGARRVSIACAPALRPLLATVAGVDAVASKHEDIPAHDYWVFPLSLPFHFATSSATIPATLPYLHALPERIARWRGRVGTHGFRVGLVWKGNPGHNNDANRSLASLTLLAPLWRIAGARYFSLQKGGGEDEADATGAATRPPITALGGEIADFADTAAIVALLDLVICVDTAVAHVAGALGKPCWVLLPRVECDWRWQTRRRDSPWYPGVMHLFRQAEAGCWEATIAELAAELEGELRSRTPGRDA